MSGTGIAYGAMRCAVLGYTANSNARNRSPGTVCTENAAPRASPPPLAPSLAAAFPALFASSAPLIPAPGTRAPHLGTGLCLATA
eukprot:3824844-Rhodomonas_salina.3